MAKVKTKLVSVQESAIEALKTARPDLFEHGTNWAISAACCELAGAERPRTPAEAKSAGGSAATGKKKAHNRKEKKAE